MKGSKSEFELSLLRRKSAERLAVVDNFVEILFGVVRRLETGHLPVELEVEPSNH